MVSSVLDHFFFSSVHKAVRDELVAKKKTRGISIQMYLASTVIILQACKRNPIKSQRMKSTPDLHHFMLSIGFLSEMRHTIEGKCVVNAVSYVQDHETKLSVLKISKTLPCDRSF